MMTIISRFGGTALCNPQYPETYKKYQAALVEDSRQKHAAKEAKRAAAFQLMRSKPKYPSRNLRH